MKILFALTLLGLNSAFPDLPKPEEDGKIWVVLAAGSVGWGNYRHQANVGHAYQIVKAHGIPDEQIIVFMRDDIANHAMNPTKGIIINKPNGPDVYKGVPKDYTGSDLDPKLFLRAMAGKSNGEGKKVVNSGPNDKIFVYFTDHGGYGLVTFGDYFLLATDLLQTVNEMYQRKRYNQMLFYWESCHSGSMFIHLNESINVFAESSANPYESSWACYCENEYNTCLGDLYSINWMENTDNHTKDLNNYTLQQQYEIVKELTKPAAGRDGSHVMLYGDKSIAKEALSTFMGSKKVHHEPENYVPVKATPVKPKEAVKFILERKALKAKTYSELQEALNDYETIVEKRKEMENDVSDILKEGFKHMAMDFFENNSFEMPFNEDGLSIPIMESCYYPIVSAFKDQCYSMVCHGYFMDVVEHFADYCKKGYHAKYVLHAIKNVCIKPKCGVN